eukprot:5118247-Amphidinium_carterae.2
MVQVGNKISILVLCAALCHMKPLHVRRVTATDRHANQMQVAVLVHRSYSPQKKSLVTRVPPNCEKWPQIYAGD